MAKKNALPTLDIMRERTCNSQCVVCGYEGDINLMLDYGSISINYDVATQEVNCPKCESSWYEVYTISHVAFESIRGEYPETDKDTFCIFDGEVRA